MSSYTFKWGSPASEVFVTGTFDDWSKSVKLEKTGDKFEKTVDIPASTEKIYYKYVVDGDWTTDDGSPSETDSSGNKNNILEASMLQTISSAAPTSTTAAMAGNVEKEPKATPKVEDAPGGFPETPGTEQQFSVNPIPGTGTGVNPQPGEANTNTIESNVTLDKESYEKSGAGVAEPGPDAVPSVSGVMIPESSLPMGNLEESNPTIQSSAPTSTTADLAAKVPKEPKESKGVPDVVTESQTTAKVEPEASASPEAVKEKKEVEEELVKKVSAEHHAVNPEVQKAIDSMNADPKSAIPPAVTESIAKSGEMPEAAANPEAVEEKSAVEAELKKAVKPTDEAGAPPETITAATTETAPVPASGDVSPTTKTTPAPADPAAPTPDTQTKPVVTTGVDSGATETKTEAAPKQSTTEEPASGTPASDKKAKRRSFFGKLKEKFK